MTDFFEKQTNIFKLLFFCFTIFLHANIFTKKNIPEESSTKKSFDLKTDHVTISTSSLQSLIQDYPKLTLTAFSATLWYYLYPDHIESLKKQAEHYRHIIFGSSLAALALAYYKKDAIFNYFNPEENDEDSQAQQESGGLYSQFSKSKVRIYAPSEIKTTFEDVAGLESAKEDLLDILDFLKNPEKFFAIGAHAPKGVLLSGPPGNGKTLLARAVAGEAQCPFLYISASEIMEAICGIGAARLRHMFAIAKELAPCIIFIDEIDAVGSK